MARSRMPLSRCLAWLCVSILVTHVNGEHLHLCFDGSEGPASLQVDGTGKEASKDGAGKARHDLDVKLGGEALSKRLDYILELPALPAASRVALVVRAIGWPVIKSAYAPPLVAAAALRWRPPLRAPPR